MEKENWIKWLQARIPALKDSANEFWLNQALEGYHSDTSSPQSARDEEIEKMADDFASKIERPGCSLFNGLRKGFVSGFKSGSRLSVNNEWVEVSERLPERDVNVIMADDEEVFEGYICSQSGYAYRANTSYACDDSPTPFKRWMPLPPIPQTKK